MQTITISTPAEKLVVSQNGAVQKPETSSSETGKLVKANATLAVWLIFLAIGGGILALYYARIDYLPEIEWKAALIYLFIGTIVGGVIGLLLTISLFIPGVLWSEFIIVDPCLDFHYTAPRNDLSSKEPARELCILSVVSHLGQPFLFALLLSHLILLAGKFLYWPLAIVILATTFRKMRRRFEVLLYEKMWSAETTCISTDAETTITRQAFKCASWFTLSVFLSQISMYVIYWLSNSPGELPFWQPGKARELLNFAILTVLCTAGVWLANHAVAVLYRSHPRRAIVASLVAAGLLLFTADNFSSLSVKLMNHYGIGYYQRFNLLVNEDGNKTLRSLGLMTKDTERHLYNVEILSKVGDQYYLRVGDRIYITLHKSEVVSMMRLN